MILCSLPHRLSESGDEDEIFLENLQTVFIMYFSTDSRAMIADWLIQLMLMVWNAEVIIHQDHAILD